MDLIAERGRRVSVEALNTIKLLAHVAEQTRDRRFDDVMIVDRDAHHYNNEGFAALFEFKDNEVLKQLTTGGRLKNGVQALLTTSVGYQDVDSRVTRYPLRNSKKPEPSRLRDVPLGERWVDAMGVNPSRLFPTG